MRTIVINNPGPQGSTGPQGVAGPSGSTQPFNNVSGDTWATTSSLQVSGSFLVSGSSTFTNIGPAIFSGSATITGATTMSSAVVSGDVTVLGTASINVLQINTTINSTGSNTLGDNANDTQTLYGTVVIPTGSLIVSGNQRNTILFTSSSLTENGLYLANTTEPAVFSNNTAPSIVLEGRQRGGSISFISKARLGFTPTIGGVVGGEFKVDVWNGSAYTSIFTINSDGTSTLPADSNSQIIYLASGTSGIVGPARHRFMAGGPLGGSGASGVCLVGIANTYSQTSTTNSEALLRIFPTINQTGAGTGIFRGVQVDPTITAITATGSWRSIEWTNNTGWGLYGSGSSPNYLNGNTLIGTTTDTGLYKFDVSGNSRIKGSGATNSTNAFVVQNSAGNNALTITNGLTTSLQGDLELSNTVIYWNGGTQIRNISNGVLRITNSSNSDFTRLQFGGNTTSYPALQRVSASLAIVDATGGTSGSLLINTTSSAGYALDVNGTARVSGQTTVQTIVPSVANTYDLGVLGNAFRNGRFSTNVFTGTLWTNDLGFQSTNLSIYNSLSVFMGRWFGTGNLVIQTGGTFTDSGFKLDVSGSGRFTNNLTVTGSVNVSGSVYLRNNQYLRSDFSGGVFNIGVFGVDTNDSIVIGSSYAAGGIVGLTSGVRYDMKPTGMGINTASPSAMLHIKGSGATSATRALRVENINASASLVVLDNGFVGIGTGSADFNLDVNGTARFGATTFPNATTINGSGNLSIGAFTLHGGFGFATFSQTTLLLTGATFTSTNGNQIGLSFGGGFAPTSGTATYSAYSILPTINQTGGANGITRGLHINPTLTSAANFRAIETTSGSVLFSHGSNPLMFISSSGNVTIPSNLSVGLTDTYGRFNLRGSDNLGATRTMTVQSADQTLIFQMYNNGTTMLNPQGAGTILVGTSVASGANLQVRGKGATSATTALRVENTNASASLVVRDDNSVEMQGGLAVAGVTGSWIIEARGTSNSGGIRRVGNNVEFYGLNYIGGFIGGYGLLDIRSYSGGSTGNTTTSAATIANSFNYNASSVRTPVLQINPNINQTGTGAFTLLDFSPTINTTGSGINYYISSSNYAVTSLGATISNILTLTPQSPLPSGVATGSFAVSSSVPPKPYFYDGTTWNALY